MTYSEDSQSIAIMLDKILARVVGGFEQAGVPLPDRKYWLVGQPAHDCEQLTVSFNQAYIGPPGDEGSSPQNCNQPRTAQLSIEVVRCIPNITGTKGKAPDETKIQDAARLQVIDAWTLLDIAGSLDTWDDDLPGRGLGVIATVEVGPPSGNLQGTVLQLAVAIP